MMNFDDCRYFTSKVKLESLEAKKTSKRSPKRTRDKEHNEWQNQWTFLRDKKNRKTQPNMTWDRERKKERRVSKSGLTFFCFFFFSMTEHVAPSSFSSWLESMLYVDDSLPLALLSFISWFRLVRYLFSLDCNPLELQYHYLYLLW